VNDALSQVYSWAQRLSRRAAGGTILLFIIFRLFHFSPSLSFQLVIALMALLIGIPHGAVDHLITLPKDPRTKFFSFIAIYILIAVAAGYGIAHWNRLGFQLVVLMSSLHFGFGDAAYSNEWQDAKQSARNPFPIVFTYALPAGFLPVVLPLTDSRALSALDRINPSIAHWCGSLTSTIRNTTLALTVFCLLALVLAKRLQLAFDLVLLVALSIVAPPLITFAVYFGCWHAIRHTARLVPKLPKAMVQLHQSSPIAAIRAAIAPGLYAVIGTLALSIILLFFDSKNFSYGLLWTTLVIVWSLTVPHMLTTAKFDFGALGKK
jgi:Brp/Blh family beta-carotene 15,15'-monooxygenase